MFTLNTFKVTSNSNVGIKESVNNRSIAFVLVLCTQEHNVSGKLDPIKMLYFRHTFYITINGLT